MTQPHPSFPSAQCMGYINGNDLCSRHQVAQLFDDLYAPPDPTRSRRREEGRCITCGRHK